MRKMVVCALAAGALLSWPAKAELQGDPEAIALAEQLVENIGGKEIWAKARTLYVVEKSRTPAQGGGIVGEFWRDLKAPREHYTLNGPNLKYQRAWTADGGYRILNGELKVKTKAEVAADELSYWDGEIYVLYHRLAAGDERLRLSLGDDPGQFKIYFAADGRHLGDFWLNADGDMYRWRHDDGTEYIYGPHREFGPISFPDWGTQVDGSWSFYYVEVRLSPDPPPVSFDPPQ